MINKKVVTIKVVFIMEKELLMKFAYVKVSTYRHKTVKTLQNTIKIPTEIAKDTGINKSHVSKVLRELKESGIVECMNEEARKGRIYRLTETGEEIANYLK